MKRIMFLSLLVFGLFLVGCQASNQPDAQMVTYNGFSGYLVATDENVPGVVMVHEWWGLNDNIKQMARELAAEGYNVLAVDLYDGKVAATPDEARTYATAVRGDSTRAIQHMKAAANYLRNDGNKVASMGWCFGGGMALQHSLQDEVDATVIYYGTLETDREKLKALNAPVLGVFGEEDTSIPVATVGEFDRALDEIGVENEIYVYEDVGHAFANPSNADHDPVKTEDAWQKTVAFLNKEMK